MLFDKPLFRPEAVRQALLAFNVPDRATAARPKVGEWAKMLATKGIDKKKETELLPGFLTDIFESVLGYVGQRCGFVKHHDPRTAYTHVRSPTEDSVARGAI